MTTDLIREALQKKLADLRSQFAKENEALRAAQSRVDVLTLEIATIVSDLTEHDEARVALKEKREKER